MKLLHVGIFLFLLTFVTSSSAMRPPRYLSVPDWQSCTSEIKPAGNSASFVCMPRHRPDACAPESWRALMRANDLKRCGRME